MMFKKIALFVLSFFILVIAAPGSLFAQEAEKKREWKFGIEAYLWGASVGGKTSSGSDINVDFNDLMDDLNMAFMGAFGAQKGKWMLIADLIYLDVSGDLTVAPGEQINGDLTGWVVTPIVGYNLFASEMFKLNVVAGARYLDLDVKLKQGSLRADDSGSVWDGIAGVRGNVDLTEKWYLTYHLDIGTGESDFTWQGLGGIGYRFKWFDLIGAYRYLKWDFDSGSELDDLELYGPFIGFKFVF